MHVANKILTNAILASDKHNIPKGKIKTNLKLLPKEILDLIQERNKLRKLNSRDPKIKDINDDINKQIRDHKEKLWKEKLSQNWDHKTNTHIFWNTLHQLQNKTTKQEPNRTIIFNNKEKITLTEKANAFNKQFVNVTKYSTDKIN